MPREQSQRSSAADSDPSLFAFDPDEHSDIPCRPALFLTADSVRRRILDISRRGVPFCASSRNLQISSRDHTLAALLRR